MAERAKTISVANLSTAAHRAAQVAISKTKNLQNKQAEAGVIIDPHWIIGLIYRNADLQYLGEYQQVANQIAGQVQKEAGGGSTATAAVPANTAVYTFDHIIILGYRPAPEDLRTLE